MKPVRVHTSCTRLFLPDEPRTTHRHGVRAYDMCSRLQRHVDRSAECTPPRTHTHTTRPIAIEGWTGSLFNKTTLPHIYINNVYVLYVYIHTYIHTCIHRYIHTCIHAYIHAYIHTYIYLDNIYMHLAYNIIYIHITYVYTHTSTNKPMRPSTHVSRQLHTMRQRVPAQKPQQLSAAPLPQHSRPRAPDPALFRRGRSSLRHPPAQ